jgi:hypothetical protein
MAMTPSSNDKLITQLLHEGEARREQSVLIALRVGMRGQAGQGLSGRVGQLKHSRAMCKYNVAISG